MNRLRITFLFIVIGYSLKSYSQEIQKPQHFPSSNSIYVEFTNPIQDISRSINDSHYYNGENRFFMPYMAIGFERSISQSHKWFLEAAVIPYTSAFGKTIGAFNYESWYGPISDPTIYTETEKYFAFAGYIGSVCKLRLLRNFYLSPSVNLYFDFMREEYSNTDPDPLANNGPDVGRHHALTLGPSISCEWLFTEKWSVSCDILGFSIGYSYLDSPGSKRPLSDFAYEWSATHKKLALALHYNF